MTQAGITQPGKGRTIAVVGDVYRFLATGDDTNGKYAIWEAIVPPGGGPLAEGASTALPPTKAEIEKLLAIAPRNGIQIMLPVH